MTEWISIKERLPENDKKVLVWQKYEENILGGERIMFYKYNTWNGAGFGKITHWMEFPEPPKC
jgi:hypothetical protein